MEDFIELPERLNISKINDDVEYLFYLTIQKGLKGKKIKRVMPVNMNVFITYLLEFIALFDFVTDMIVTV